jgi:hypothetical protein
MVLVALTGEWNAAMADSPVSAMSAPSVLAGALVANGTNLEDADLRGLSRGREQA